MLKKLTEQEILNSVKNLPVLSAVVSRTLAIIRDPDCSVRELTELLGKDQSISARIIKIANSAFYGYPRQIRSLSEAIVILGFNKIRSLLITVSVSQPLSVELDGYMIEKGDLWKHSYAVAFTCGLITKFSMRGDSDEAFTVGILHDIGKLVLGQHLKNSYKRILSVTTQDDVTLSVAEERVLGYHHATVGGMMLEQWNFPDSMTNAVRMHHDPMNEKTDAFLVGTLHLADGWVKSQGLGINVEFKNEDLYEQLQKDLRISDDIKEKVSEFLLEEMDKMKELFPDSNARVQLAHMPS